MNLKKGTPGQGGGVRAESFSYTPVASGLRSAFNAWMAGEAYWCQAHEHTEATPGTKPCLDWLTDGALRCPRCRPQVLATWVGYVPLWREADGKPIIVIVHEAAMDLLKGLSYCVPVIVGRVDATSSVFVRKSDNGVSMRTDNEQRRRPVNITRDLLSMWKIPTLEAWLLEERRAVGASPVEIEAAEENLSEATTENPKDVKATFLLGASWAGGLTDDEQKQLSQRRNEAFARGTKKPPKNGRH